MLNRIIRFSLQNRLAILALSLLLLVGGIYTASRMEVDVFPDLNAPTVVVMTEANGMAPEEVERLVTFPVETAVNGATDVRRVRSSSTTGFSIVWVEFNWGTDIYRARQVVSEKLAVIRDELPATVGNPTLGPQSSILGELMFVALTVDSIAPDASPSATASAASPSGTAPVPSAFSEGSVPTSLQDLRTLADWQIRPRLLATGGVAQVSVLGGEIKEYQILLHPQRMRHHGITLSDIYAAVDDMNRNRAGGILYEYGNEYIIRGILSTSRVEELAHSLIKQVDGQPIYLDAVADVRIGDKTPKMGVASYNGQSSVVMTITKQPNTSTLELTEQLDRVLAEVQQTLPADVHLSTDVYRQSRFIETSVSNVGHALLEGAIFVIIVLFIFLMNARTTLISLVTIPLSLLASIVVLQLLGLTINTMSLGGLCIAIGSLVDDAIVDVENVYKRLRENRALTAERRRLVLQVIYDASREVRMPILNSTLIIVASFLPLFFLSGMEGRMLAPLGIAFIVALCSSTLVALTLTPVLCSYLLGKEGVAPVLDASTSGTAAATAPTEPYVARHLKRLYNRTLQWALAHRPAVLGSTAAALVLAIVLFFTLGRSFLPPFNEGSFTINVSTLPGISLEESDQIGRMAEEALLAIPEIQAVGRKTGRAELDEHALGVNTSEIEAPFVLQGRSKEALMADVRQRLKLIPGANIEVGSPISHRIDAMLSGTRASIAIKLFGTDLNRMFTLGNEIREAIADVPGIADLNVEQQVERPQLQITPRREMLGRYGITLPEFGRLVSVLLAGEAVSQVYEGNQAFDLTLKVSDQSRLTIEQLRTLMVDAGGQQVPLGNIAHITSGTGPNTINRENVARKVVISANVADRGLLQVVNDIRERIDSRIEMPEGYHVEYGGQFESEQAASRTLLLTSLFSLLVIFLLLYNQFHSTMQASVILLNLPLALIGGVVAIWLTGGVISIPATIGFISLFGIATRNGMLLIARYNDLRQFGHSPLECVMMGSADRLNPILMTALTSALALIPMVLGGDQPGNEIQSPMAIVILGGLFTSTLLNGFIVPIMYLYTTKKE